MINTMANNTKHTTTKGRDLMNLPTSLLPNFIESSQKPFPYFTIKLKKLITTAFLIMYHNNREITFSDDFKNLKSYY